MPIRVGIGQDSHRFSRSPEKRFVIAGIEITGTPGMVANSDGDVVFHAICNALATISGFSVMGPYADNLCEQGVIDSAVYLSEAVNRVEGYRICSVSVAIECKRPKLQPHVEAMRAKVAEVLSVDVSRVMITVTSGDELSAFGEGKGIQAFATVAAMNDELLRDEG